MSFKYTCTWFYGLNTAFEVESASTGLHRRHTIAPPFLYRHSPGATVPNRSSTGMSRGYVGSPPWHTVAKPGVTVSPPWTQLMPVLLRLHPVVFLWRKGRATVMPRNNSVLFRNCVCLLYERSRLSLNYKELHLPSIWKYLPLITFPYAMEISFINWNL